MKRPEQANGLRRRLHTLSSRPGSTRGPSGMPSTRLQTGGMSGSIAHPVGSVRSRPDRPRPDAIPLLKRRSRSQRRAPTPWNSTLIRRTAQSSAQMSLPCAPPTSNRKCSGALFHFAIRGLQTGLRATVGFCEWTGIGREYMENISIARRAIAPSNKSKSA